MTQASLFTETARKPAPRDWTHCGVRAVMGEPQDLGGCINTPILCATCGREIGVQSTRTDL